MPLPTSLFVSGIVLTLAGVWGNWRLAWYHSAIEEGLKEYRLTRAQARMRHLLLKRGLPLVTLVGLGLLGVGAFGSGG